LEKKAASGIMLTLLLASMLTLTFNIQPVKAEPRTWTVDDDGPADFNKIQEAVNAAGSGDIIFVKAGIYYENVVVNRSLSLIGENSSSTIVDGMFTGTVMTITVGNVDITGFTIQEGGLSHPHAGIYVSSSGNNISYNIISNNGYGIELNCSSDNIVSKNKIAANLKCGIWLEYSSNNRIYDNNITANGDGIFLVYSSNRNNITRNNITANRFGGGIGLALSSDNIVSGNKIIANNGGGIYLDVSSQNNSISGNHVTNNSQDGIWLMFSSNNKIFGNNVTANKRAGIVSAFSSNNSISGNHVSTNNFGGIFIGGSIPPAVYSNNITLSRNNITANNGAGIELLKGLGNSTISGNKITNNHFGVRIVSSSNILRNNAMAGNSFNFGVELHSGTWGSQNFTDFINDVDISNTINGKPVYYWVGKRDAEIPFDAGYVALINCTNIKVENLTLTNNGQGAFLAFTQGSTVSRNNFTHNEYGIEVVYSSNYNSIFRNNIEANNRDGIELQSSSNNSLFGNNITNNMNGHLALGFFGQLYLGKQYKKQLLWSPPPIVI